ncbi:NUDIX hydrolase [Alkalicoccus daliensis]|uniref:ADP-ribose pyrophosphatase n=1 Tax=Alkalicoccus daliensis TaxID=745820 RepID=A0A1H0AZQ8_9BACI|nr:NUDIX hydrolase [Alkalicoccus daliensis]SDN38952.1 ADP-ribose pyrophosphatase [Alkalicoccus daliensis]
MKKLYEETIKTESIYKGKIIDLELQEVVLPNGSHSKREIVNHPGAVAVICITGENKMVMVRQYRKALKKSIIEIPAGKLDAGEKPEDCAKRELEEETGIIAGILKECDSFYTSPGFANELVYVYEAENLRQGEVHTDEDEFVERMDVTLTEAKKLIRSGEIHDAKTIYAIQYWELKQYNKA